VCPWVSRIVICCTIGRSWELCFAKIQSENIMDVIFDVKGRSETDFWREKECPVTAYRRRAAIVRTASTQQTHFSCPLSSILFRIDLRTGSGG
jgi:hypothetical protein